jgi:DNA topoisomerase-3
MRLVIAEKKSVAQSLSAVLNANERKGGFLTGEGFIISWCAGHLLELAPPNAYNEKFSKWKYADLPIIPDEWKYVPSKGKEAQLKILSELMNRPDVDCVINACDAGREGENIFRHVYNYARCTKKTYRLWIASLEPAAIKAGFDNLKNGAEYDNLYAAAYCRERADWLVGLNSTRAFSTLYGSTLNAGRVQSPTLAMLVKREADIAGFVKEPFYIPVIDCAGQGASFTACGDRHKDRQAAEAIRAACDGGSAVVRSVERQKKTTAPPKLYDLTTLQREANRIFGFTAQQTLNYAQSLYEKAVMSYPRVDSRYLTSDMRGTTAALVKQLQKDTAFNSAGINFTPDIDRLINDNKVSDHHAIIPTAEMAKTDLSALSVGERDILNLVAVRLLCAAAPVHSYESVIADVDCGGYDFAAKGKTIITDGWKAIDTAFRASLKAEPGVENDCDNGSDIDNTALPELTEGHTFSGVTAILKEGTTSPPRPFTEDTALSNMETAGAADMPEDAERRGLGTPATRAAIIEKIIKTGFVERQKKNLIPTDKGKNLIAVLPDTLTSPLLTATWEHKLKEVERGELSAEEFMRGIEDFTKTIIAENNAPKPEFAGLFANNNPNTKPVSAPIGVCPRCGAPVREFPKGFFCDTQTCGFKLWKESKFWTAKKKKLTAKTVAALLKDGEIYIDGLFSERTGKTYAATIILDDTGSGFVNFKLNFDNNTKKTKKK